MKSNKINLALIVCAIFIQRLLFQTITFEVYKVPFASSLMIFQSQTGNLLMILYVFVPIPFILFEFSGMIQGLTEGYGKLWIIRAYKKDKLYLKTIGIGSLKLLMVVLFQTFLFCIADEKWLSISDIQIILSVGTYYLGIYAIVLLQFILELWFDASYANLVCNIFCVVSLFLGNMLLPVEKTRWFGMLFFPNMLFGTRNGIIYQEKINMEYEYVLLYLVIIVISIGVLSIVKFKKKDIF